MDPDERELLAALILQQQLTNRMLESFVWLVRQIPEKEDGGDGDEGGPADQVPEHSDRVDHKITRQAMPEFMKEYQ